MTIAKREGLQLHNKTNNTPPSNGQNRWGANEHDSSTQTRRQTTKFSRTPKRSRPKQRDHPRQHAFMSQRPTKPKRNGKPTRITKSNTPKKGQPRLTGGRVSFRASGQARRRSWRLTSRRLLGNPRSSRTCVSRRSTRHGDLQVGIQLGTPHLRLLVGVCRSRTLAHHCCRDPKQRQLLDGIRNSQNKSDDLRTNRHTRRDSKIASSQRDGTRRAQRTGGSAMRTHTCMHQATDRSPCCWGLCCCGKTSCCTLLLTPCSGGPAPLPEAEGPFARFPLPHIKTGQVRTHSKSTTTGVQTWVQGTGERPTTDSKTYTSPIRETPRQDSTEISLSAWWTLLPHRPPARDERVPSRTIANHTEAPLAWPNEELINR